MGAAWEVVMGAALAAGWEVGSEAAWEAARAVGSVVGWAAGWSLEVVLCPGSWWARLEAAEAGAALSLAAASP